MSDKHTPAAETTAVIDRFEGDVAVLLVGPEQPEAARQRIAAKLARLRRGDQLHTSCGPM